MTSQQLEEEFIRIEKALSLAKIDLNQMRAFAKNDPSVLHDIDLEGLEGLIGAVKSAAYELNVAAQMACKSARYRFEGDDHKGVDHA